MWCQIQKRCWARPLPVIKLLATQKGYGEEKGDCFPHRPLVLSNSSVLLNHQLSLGPCAVLAGPNLASIFTLYRMPCLHPTISGVLAPRVLGDQATCHKPLLYNQVTCPSPAKCLGEIVTYLLRLLSEKKNEAPLGMLSSLSL